LAGLPAAIRRAKEEGVRVVDSTPDVPPPIIPLRAWTKEDAVSGLVELHAAVSVGRALWLHNMKHVLTETIRAMGRVEWSVMRPYGDARWFTSDDPVVRLDFNSLDDYDCFAGGWDRKGSEVLVPLSPTVLLYRQAHHVHPPVIQATAEQTLLVQRFLAEHAFREIYALTESRQAETFRARIVDAAAYKFEQREWADWNKVQSDSELDPAPNSGPGDATPGLDAGGAP